MESLSTPIALVIAAGAILAGSVVVAVALLRQAGALRALGQVIDDVRHGLSMLQENQAHIDGQLLQLRKKRLEMAEQDRRAGLVARMRGTLTLLEDSQEFKASYFLLVTGPRQVLADKVRAVLSNSRDQDLAVTIDAINGLVLEPGAPYEGEVTISVRDLARINLPFVPEFNFLRESCRLMLSVEFEERDGEKVLVEKNLLER
jgi:hypothetical protein